MLREVENGELIRIDQYGIHSSRPFDEQRGRVKPSLCAFEFAYFSRPDNRLYGESVEKVRFEMGQRLAREAPVEADIVVGAPNSGISAAYGYVDVSKIPIQQGLTKNPYVGRSFIATSQAERARMARLKLSPNPDIVSGKRVVVVDDSIVRSTTSKEVVTMLREKGATEVHLRIASPPYKWPCHYGMDTGDINELTAASRAVEEIREEVGADSLGYLSVEAFESSMGSAAGKVCMACMTGEYPTPIPEESLILRAA
jgi:amidophosphoribosyltransferase